MYIKICFLFSLSPLLPAPGVGVPLLSAPPLPPPPRDPVADDAGADTGIRFSDGATPRALRAPTAYV